MTNWEFYKQKLTPKKYWNAHRVNCENCPSGRECADYDDRDENNIICSFDKLDKWASTNVIKTRPKEGAADNIGGNARTA